MLFHHLVRQRLFIYLAVAGLSGAGVWAALTLPAAIYPEVAFPRIAVVAQGTALGARQVVFSVTRPIEEAVSIIPGVERVRSRTIRGASDISVFFAPRTDMAYALQLVQARVNQLRSELPRDLDLEVERLTPALFPILSYNIEGGDPATLFDLARYRIKPVLSRIPGVGRVDVQGTDVREIEVVADPARLAGLGLTYGDVAAAIRAATTVEAVGRVSKDYKQFLILTDQEAHTTDDIGAVVVAGRVRVRDLATVSLGTEDRVRLIRGDGGPAALVNVSRRPGGNTLFVADSVASTMAALARTLPPGVRVKPVYDQAALVRDAVSSVRDAMLIGAVLAVLVLIVFLDDRRLAAVSAAAIPLTLIISIFVMKLLGQTFNLMSLGAMAVAIGLVVDDAVVVVENIARHRLLDRDRIAAVAGAVQELIWPVTTSTVTTVVVFLPLVLLEGVVGQFFAALAITLSVAVILSLVLALTLIPLASEQLLDAEDAAAPPPRGPRTPVGRALARAREAIDGLGAWYERSLAVVIGRPKRVAIVALILVVGGAVAARFIGTGFLPVMDEGAFVLDYFTPGGTALAETDRQVMIAESILARTPEIEGTSRRTGAELGLFATAQNTGDIVARLRPRSRRSRDIFQVIEQARIEIATAAPRLRIEFIQILSDVINDLAGNPNPVEIKLFGDRLDALEDYARTIAPPLESIPGLVDLYNGVSESSPELRMRVDGAEAARVGLTPEGLGEALSAALLGVPAGEVRGDDRAIPVRVRAPDAVRFNPIGLGAIPVSGAGTSRPTPLGALVTLREVDSRAELVRENQRQMIAVTGGVEGRSLGGVMRDVRGVLARTPAPAGITVELGGQYASQQQAFRALVAVLGLAALAVVAVMVIQFESLIEPVVILLAAPLSFVGALVLLLVLGLPLNVSSFMGLILLVGLIVKNGIILIDFTHRRMREAGLPLEAAIREAARTRLRPILMTTLCTLFGLFPLALGLGPGSEMQRTLAVAVIGGLGLSTPITLFMVPTVLVAIRGRGYTLDRSTI